MKIKTVKVGLHFGLRRLDSNFIFKNKPAPGKRISTIYCLVLLAAAVVHPLPGYSNDHGFQNISIDDGLSQNSISCILQDRSHFMWFGSEDGLNRYDGYGFKSLPPQPAPRRRFEP